MKMAEYRSKAIPLCHTTRRTATTSIHAEVVGNANTYTIALQSNVYAPFVEVDFKDADVILSDNIINLTDDKPRVISFTTEDIINGNFTDATDVKNRLRIRSLRDTY